jgi:Pyruvate/2-oxoacid:ferredoxin oxidoreductase delta subunit
MAEFCLDCYNKINKTNYTDKDAELEYEFCEGCGKEKLCVIMISRSIGYKFKQLFLK